MYPGPNDTDWQVATFQHRELVHQGQRQQVVARALSATADPQPASAAARRPLGPLPVRAGQCLLGLQAIVAQHLALLSGGVASRG